MYINKIDELIDDIINKFNIFLNKKKSGQSLLDNILKDTNFVKYQNIILKNVTNFINKIDLFKLKLKKNNINIIQNTIIRYCMFYLYLSIAYFYKGGRDLFITNMIESSKYQKDSKIQIQNFFNSDNNSKIINFYSLIKNFLEIQSFKTVERINIILKNNPLKYKNIVDLFDNLGENYIVKNLLIKNNFHNLIKTLIFKNIYINEEKNEIISILHNEDKKNAEYKYIDVVVSKIDKIVDITYIQNFVTQNNLPFGYSKEIYQYLNNYKSEQKINVKTIKDIVNFMFNNKKIIPITDDFLRYHNNKEKYGSEGRENTKIKYIINKMKKVQNYYSEIFKKNPKLKQETEKLFFKQLENKNAVLINDNEEIKIIKKLEESDQTVDKDFLIDLENYRNYSYVNFRDFKDYGIKFRPKKTIEAVRLSSFLSKKNNKLDLRIGNDLVDLNIVGLIWNFNERDLNSFLNSDFVDVRTKSNNGFDSFLNIMRASFTKNDKNTYFWIFNLEKDKVKISDYKNVSSLNMQKNIELMISELYREYVYLVKTKIIENLKKIKEINLWKLNNLLSKYQKKYHILDFDNNAKNEIIYEILRKNLKELQIIEDKSDYLKKGKDIIKLPLVKIEEKKENKIILKKEVDEKIQVSESNSICYHHVKWRQTIKTKDNQDIFNFVKQYVKQDKNGEFICKSCGEVLNLRKYVYEGTYIEELDTFLTTSLAVNQELKNIPKYSKLSRTIQNIEKNIEKICYSMELSYYLGNTPVIKLRRRLIIKDTIDLILLHSDFLRNQPKSRKDDFEKKYNIKKSLSILFFFPLKDDIFLASSEDTDKFKIIKFNNVIAYISLILISELNSGQILGLKSDKRCNYFIYSKVCQQIFDKIFIRYGLKEKILILKIPLLAYIIFYFSCMLTNNLFWLWNSKNKSQIFNIQKSIIHTIIDMINTIMEANLEKEKNFFYEIISARLMMKMKNLFNDKNLLKRVRELSMKNIKIDKNKISFITKKIKTYELSGKYRKFKISDYYSQLCDSKLFKLNKKIQEKKKYKLDLLTNCPDGKFHSWQIKDEKLICTKCNQNYLTLVKEVKKNSKKDESLKILDKIKLANLKKLTKTYCLDGKIHKIDSKGVCSLCKIDPLKYKYKEKELLTLDNNLKRINDEKSIKNIKKIKNKIISKKNEEENIDKIMRKFNKRYVDNTKGKLNNYIIDFIDRLKKNIGKKIKLDGKDLFLDETIYTINHDKFGNKLKKEIIISSKEGKIIFEKNETNFKKDILYFYNNKKKIIFAYDALSYKYLGFLSFDKKKINKIDSSDYLIVKISLQEMIINLAYTNKYINVIEIDNKLKNESRENLKKVSNILLNKIIRNRTNRMKNILQKTLSIIYNIKNKNKVIVNSKEKRLIKSFQKNISKIKMKDKENHNRVFKNIKYIINRVEFNKLPENINLYFNKNYIYIEDIKNLNNSDDKLLFFLIFNLNRLIDYNSKSETKNSIIYFIVKLLNYLYSIYHVPIENVDLRVYNFFLLNETPYVDPSVKNYGFYQELMNQEEIDDVKNKNFDANQEMTSLDIDDYDVDGPDLDGASEALDIDNSDYY